ncbi:hypothetical protein [Acinetobacter seifertii]|uniref:hypothetical protein n=1 Tax=Acinetobacter seifertii TaxID=1530123 RepID=UPI003862A094
MTNRYVNKPFLRLLELYILWVVKELPKEKNELLIKMEPQLQKTYKSKKKWYEIIADEMELNENFNSEIIEKWEKIKLYNNNVELFSQKIVDTYFMED